MTLLQPVLVEASEAWALAAQGTLADTYGPFIQLDRPISAAELGAEPVVAIGADIVGLDGSPTLHPDDLVRVCDTVAHAPVASVALCVLLRASSGSSDLATRFVLESTTYSMLQAGPEFAAWREDRNGRPDQHRLCTDDSRGAGEPTVVVSRSSDTLTIVLNRPSHGNAIDNDLRDRLTDALMVAVLDDSIEQVELSGDGPHFCTGGDLDTFGTFASPSEAHLVRLTRSPARMMATLGPRVTATVHGRCMGSGVELAAFAHHVRAAPDTTFELPELTLGLVPGAGGTISVVDRIGAPRTAWLLLTRARIDAHTALRWGLIDSVSSAAS